MSVLKPQSEQRAATPLAASVAMDRALAELAARQDDVVTAKQLRECGLTGDAINVRLRRAQLHRRHRGVYAVGSGVLKLRGILTAAVLACGPGAVLSHFAAAAWWEMTRWEDRRPDVIVPRAGGRRRREIRARSSSSLHPADVWRRGAILVTSPARTLLDLATELDPFPLRRLVRQALAERRVTIEQLQATMQRSAGHRGAGRLRDVLAAGHVPTRSGFEDEVIDALVRAGVDMPEANVTLELGACRRTPDLLWRDAMLVVELNGGPWHHDPLTQADDRARLALYEKHGYRALSVCGGEFQRDPGRVVARLASALAAQRAAVARFSA